LRDDGLLLSPARAREWWWWLQTFTSFGVGGSMWLVVGVEQLRQFQERRHEAGRRAQLDELDHYVAACTREALLLANPTAQTRHIRVAKPVVIERAASLVQSGERWNATWVDGADLVLAPGQSARLRYVTTPGVWGAELAFDLDVGNIQGWVSCPLR
jgi:hypothetical protein